MDLISIIFSTFKSLFDLEIIYLFFASFTFFGVILFLRSLFS